MKIIISTFFIFFSISCFSQFHTDWENRYYVGKDAIVNDILKTRKGEVIAVGGFINEDLMIPSKNAFFLKVKNKNNEITEEIIQIETLKTKQTYEATALAETCDHQFVVVGYQGSRHKRQGWATIVDEGGNEVKKNVFKDYIFEKETMIHDVIVTYENHIIMVGSKGNLPWIWKFDGLEKGVAIFSEGEWKGSKGMNVVKKIVATRDGHYAIVGVGKNRVIFQKIAINPNSKTKVVQIAILTYPNFWDVLDMIQKIDGGFVMVGYRKTHREQIILGIVGKNSKGKLIKKATKAIVARSHNRGTAVVETNDRKLIVTGFGTSYDIGQVIPRGFVTIFDNEGNLIEKDLTKWNWFGGINEDRITTIAKVGAQELIVAGNSRSKVKKKDGKGLWTFQLHLNTLKTVKHRQGWSFPIENNFETFRTNYPFQFSFSAKPVALYCYRNGKPIPWADTPIMLHDTIRNQYTYTQFVPLALGKNDVEVFAAFEEDGKTTTDEILVSKTHTINRVSYESEKTYPKEHRIALLIGNGDYLGEKGNSCAVELQNPLYDVDSLENVLKLLDFEVWKYKNLGKEEMENVLKAFRDTLPNFNIRLFYYAGHGFQQGNINYLQPLDGCMTNVNKNIPLNDVIHTMKVAPDLPTDFVINNIILDACRINADGRIHTDAPNARFGERIVLTDTTKQGFTSIPPIDNFYITYATAPNQPAYDGLKTLTYNSPFAKAFVKCLKYSGLGVNDVFEAIKTEIEALFKERNRIYKTQISPQRPKMESGLKARKGVEFRFNF